MEFYTSYHESGFQIGRREKSVDRVIAVIRKQKFQKLPLVVTGLSGLSIGFPVAYKLKMPIAVVRKARERSHASTTVEGYQPDKSYIIIDDFIDTGATIKRIHKAITRNVAVRVDPKSVRCVGIILYDRDYNYGNEEEIFTLNKQEIPIYYA